MDASHEITQLLIAWGQGDATALERLMSLVYEDLRHIARKRLRLERQGHTLQTTALVHEAYFRLMDQKQTNWQNRAQFFALAAKMMRRILVDHARHRLSERRGGGAEHIELSEASEVSASKAAELVALDDALQKLTKQDDVMSNIVELKYFGGYTEEEISTILNLSLRTVQRQWNFARDWLKRELKGDANDEEVTQN
jgi:RNA polymerase sigma factor (TIGR02999 family)